MLPPNRGGGGASSSSSTSRTTTTRSPPYYTTPRPLLTTSPGQRHRTTTIRPPVLVPAGGSSPDNNRITDPKHKSGRPPPVQVLPPAPQPPALPPQEFCSPRLNADISWPRTQQGQTAKQPCPVGILGMETAVIASAKLLPRFLTLFLVTLCSGQRSLTLLFQKMGRCWSKCSKKTSRW